MLSLLIWSIFSSILAGGVATLCYYIYFFVKTYIETHFISAVTLDSHDNMYQWTMDYLILKGYIKKGISNYNCRVQRSQKGGPFWLNADDFDQDTEKPKISYSPGIGFHSFKYKGLNIHFSHQVQSRTTMGFDRKPTTIESIRMFTYGLGHVKQLKELCQEAMEYAISQDKDKTNIYSLAEYFNAWEKVQSKKNRQLDSVILDSNITEEIMNDIINFKQNLPWYIERGIPYRRGYLLYGPPGTGKTSFILALAGHLKLSICTLNLSGNELDDERLNKVLEVAPRNAIILLEDVDAIFVERTSVSQKREGRKVSFSGLLNALDGVRSQEGRVLFLTTNHIEKLDPALLRPGRADVHVKLDYATSKQIQRMFQRFFPNLPQKVSEDFTNKVPANKLSMAKVQGHLLRYKKDAQKAIDNVNELIEIEEYTNEMNLKEWLFRLGFEQYAPAFFKENLWRVGDLKDFNESDLEKYGIKLFGEVKRFSNMLKGDDKAKKAFCLLSKASIRALIGIYIKDTDRVEGLVKIVPEFFVTEYHLRDVLEEDSKETLETRLKNLVEYVKKFRETGEIKKKIEEVKIFPKESPEDILNRLGMQKFIEEFKKSNALSPEIFYGLNNDDLLRVLKVELVGKRKKLMKIIDEFNAKKEDKEEEEVILENLTIQGLKKQSSINY